VDLVDKNIRDNALSVEFLADQCAMSRATFYRKMESLLNQPPSVFIRTFRLKKAAKLLQSGNYYIAEAAYETGFSNPKYFSKCFQKEFGASPSEYIKTLTDASPN
jgi:AraC-like DNA-binding protein